MEEIEPEVTLSRVCELCNQTVRPPVAIIKPCSHLFHQQCLQDLLESITPVYLHCPVIECHSIISEIRYTRDDTHLSHFPGSVMPGRGPFIRADEEITPGMSLAEMFRRKELRRVRTLEDISDSDHGTFKSAAVSQDGAELVQAQQTFAFSMTSSGGTYLETKISYDIVITVDPNETEQQSDDHNENPELVASVQEEITSILGNLGLKSPFMSLAIKDPAMEVTDEHGRGVVLKRELKANKWNGRKNTRIYQQITLVETVPESVVHHEEQSEHVKDMRRLVQEARREAKFVIYEIGDKYRDSYPVVDHMVSGIMIEMGHPDSATYQPTYWRKQNFLQE